MVQAKINLKELLPQFSYWYFSDYTYLEKFCAPLLDTSYQFYFDFTLWCYYFTLWCYQVARHA